ncbi:MlaA family lipoprotein [Billgrantia kenyensis]|uniref:VacJ family lipoprotein n=1 Tax=Billgrantia kenyensis TaxID=321266 RepID=A0A7V9W092_9GAMM|nr:VacJ family lipoprotein [Halomonas kenyensis]MBA2778652.1 VacJ family lipoprotein [Halomonas kenyensis]MCG6661543.1 VacJ family lipoprotein [Halomonas kenyensis]
MVVKQARFYTRALVVLATLAMLAGCAGRVAVEDRHPDDPWEGFNRQVFAFNEAVDRAVLKPVARGYRTVTPQPVQTGVGNFFSNLGEIRTALNSLLQGKPANAGRATSRFVINSTVGIAGLWDFATHMGITVRDEDFGQTLGVWGVAEGPYLVLPFLGPSTVRDTAGLPLDTVTYPVYYVENDKVRYGLTALRVIDLRAGFLDQEELIRGDRYVFIRDAYLQRRRFEVSDGELGDDPFASDEFDFDFDDADFDDAEFAD